MIVSVDKKTLKLILVICILAVSVCAVTGINELIKTADYMQADGILLSIDRYVDTGLNNYSGTQVIRYKKYSYIVNDKEYICQYRTYLLFKSKIGSYKKIYYLSSDPRKVRDEFKIKTSIAGGIFFTFFGVMMLLFIRKSNEETMDYQKQPKIKI